MVALFVNHLFWKKNIVCFSNVGTLQKQNAVMKSLSSLVEMSESCFFLFLQRSNNNNSNVFSSLTLSEIQAWSESFERLMASLGESIISEHF